MVVPRSRLNRARWDFVSDDGSLKAPSDRSIRVVLGSRRSRGIRPASVASRSSGSRSRPPRNRVEPLEVESCVYLVASTSRSYSLPRLR